MRVGALLAVACLGAAAGSPVELGAGAGPLAAGGAAGPGSRDKRSPRQNWVQIFTSFNSDDDEDYAKSRRRPGAPRGGLVPLALPAGGSSQGSILPLFLLPLQGAGYSLQTGYEQEKDEVEDYEDRQPVTKWPRRPVAPSRRPADRERQPERPPAAPADRERQPERPPAACADREPEPERPPAPRGDTDCGCEAPATRRPDGETKKTKYPAYVRADQLDEPPKIPTFSKAASSKELVEKFRAQVPQAPELPPALFSEYDGSERVAQPAAEVAPGEQPAPPAGPARSRSQAPLSLVASFGREPPRPRLARSVVLVGELTVPRADYSEAYTIWYDADTGAARGSFHGGSAATYRSVLPDGSVQRLEMHVDRSGEAPVRRCGLAVSPQGSAADRAPPALPDMEQFTFAGYEQAEGGRAERWRRSVAGRAGQLGGARGEALTARHELLLLRAADDAPRPLRYSVAVDSSALGADCDGYHHRYLDVRDFRPDDGFFTPKIDELCDHVETLNASAAEHLARLEPLLEFTLPHRDLRYDDALQRFKKEYNRQYLDDTEEAVRKNVLMQSLRFIASGNREGATFELSSNFLTDRLDAELGELRGVSLSAENTRAERFPHARDELRAEEPRLPERFDWRPRGAVSPVRYQGTCSSCWAFAVAGAVEGALFVLTRRLVPLSEKCLVDCAHPFGGNGCKGTWPSHAYDYIQNRGLPALEEYPEYKDKVDTCAEQTVRPVTRISGHVNVTANSVPALQVAIRRHAPTVVIIDAKAKSFVFYKKGVLYDDRCAKNPKKLNHAVLAVGWGRRRGEPHFILKNSWSEAWGERGYVRVQARANTCGVLARPSYPRLGADDPLYDPHGASHVSPRHARY